MKEIKIIYNGVFKEIKISEKFATELRVWKEFECMVIENLESAIPEQYKGVLINDLPKDIADNYFRITELERQYDNYEARMTSKLIKKIEKVFKTKVIKERFIWLKLPNENNETIFDCFDS